MRLMKVRLEYAHWHGGRLYLAGDVLTLDDASARWLIGKGLAEAVEEDPIADPDPDADAQIAGDEPQPNPESVQRRLRGKTLLTPTSTIKESDQ